MSNPEEAEVKRQLKTLSGKMLDERVYELRCSGFTVNRMADLLGVTRQRVTQRTQAHRRRNPELPPTPWNAWQPGKKPTAEQAARMRKLEPVARQFSPARDAELLKLYLELVDQGIVFKEIAKAAGKTTSTVYQRTRSR